MAATVRSSVLTGRRCVEAPDAGPLTIENSTLSSSAVTSCLELGAQSIMRGSSVQRSTNLLPELPPPVVVTQGLVEDSAVTGGLQLAAPTAVARRVRAIGAIGIFGAGLVVDSLAQGFGTDEAAIVADAPQGGTLRVVNSTALSTHGPALLANAVHSATGPVTPNDLVVTNTIARGQGTDIQAPATLLCALGSFCDLGLIHIDHSDFATRAPPATGASGRVIAEGAGNIAGDPLFADAARGDYRLRAGSPAIDAGAALDLALPTDLDGSPRTQGGAPDLGAFEFSPLAGPPGDAGAREVDGGAGDGGAGLAGGPIDPDRAAPVLGRVHLSRARIRLGAGAEALGRARRHVARGTTVTTAVSEAATISFAVELAAGGRLRGSACVAPTRALRRAGRCTRWIARGAVLTRRAVAAGPVALAFGGRLGAHPLAPARYRFAVSATDAAGNRSATRFAGFTVVA